MVGKVLQGLRVSGQERRERRRALITRGRQRWRQQLSANKVASLSELNLPLASLLVVLTSAPFKVLISVGTVSLFSTLKGKSLSSPF